MNDATPPNGSRVPLIGQRRITLGGRGKEINLDIQKDAGAPDFFVQTVQVVQQTLATQGRPDLAAQCDAFTLEPAARATFIAAADSIAEQAKEIEKLKAELARLRELVDPGSKTVVT